jgi:FkbM family methyltransferase
VFGNCVIELFRRATARLFGLQLVQKAPAAALCNIVQRSYPLTLDERVAMTCRCRDCDKLPKVQDAGKMFDLGGERIQIMHEGSKVVAGGYYGDWMAHIIESLHGHHEPQEEFVFHHIIKHVRPASLIVELGAFWAYYSNWYLGAVPGARAVCVEPDANHLACGRRNFELNNREALLINGCIGALYTEKVALQRESDCQQVEVPQHNMNSLFEIIGKQEVELLHIDAQGAELPFLESTCEAVREGLIRFLFLSTHHQAISGSPTTHQDCLQLVRNMGGTILAEHSVEESFSGDGLVVASFDPQDKTISIPEISVNSAEESLFGPALTAQGLNVS